MKKQLMDLKVMMSTAMPPTHQIMDPLTGNLLFQNMSITDSPQNKLPIHHLTY